MADRHYSRKTIGSEGFTPPGRALVLWQPGAYWVTSWPFTEWVQHAWPGAWLCSAFRREDAPGPASDLIVSAVAHTRAWFGAPPPQGMVTFIDRARVRPIMRRGTPHWGYSYEHAGFVAVGETVSGLLVLQLMPEAMPPAVLAHNMQARLFATAAIHRG